MATFTAPSNSNLDRNTRYAIVLASAASNIKLFATGVDVTGLDTTALVSADSGSTWTQTSGSNQLMIRVNGTAAGNILPPPLPTNIFEDPIVSNLVAPGPISGHVLLGNSKDGAQGFTTGAYPRSGITLTSISVSLRTGVNPLNIPPSAKLVTVAPIGSTFTTLTSTATLTPNETDITVNYRPGSRTLKLAPSTTYWLVLEGGTNDTGWNYKDSDVENSSLAHASIFNWRRTRNADSNTGFALQAGPFLLKVNGVPDGPSPVDPDKVLLSNLHVAGNNTSLQLTNGGHVAQEFDLGANRLGHNLQSIDVAFRGQC